MWYCSMPDPPECLEIGISIPNEKCLNYILIWNYNKSLLDSTKGIKELEILLNGNVIWYGIIIKGTGNDREDYCTKILVN